MGKTRGGEKGGESLGEGRGVVADIGGLGFPLG